MAKKNKTVHEQFNIYRAARGLGSVQQKTVARYINGGCSGSRLFDQFVREYLKANN